MKKTALNILLTMGALALGLILGPIGFVLMFFLCLCALAYDLGRKHRNKP